MTLQTTNSREKNVKKKQSVTPHIIYLFSPPLRINHRSMTWRIFTEWLGGGGVVIVTDCVLLLLFFYASEWQTDSLSMRFRCVLGPKSTCLQRLHLSNTTSCRRVSLRVGWESECVADARRKSSHSAWMLALTKRRKTLPFPYYMDFDTKGWSSTRSNCCFYEEHVGPKLQPPKQTQQINTTNKRQTCHRAATQRPARQEWHISSPMDDLYCGYKANSHRTPSSPRTQTKRAKSKVELGPVRTLGVGPAHAAEEGDLLKPKRVPEVGNL